MTRTRRDNGNSGYMHIISRGVNQQDLFYEDMDYYVFLRILRRLKNEMGFDVIAYCLMSNHIHLLVFDKQKRFSEIMKRILLSYVFYFNKKYERAGHLVQERFFSRPVETEESFLITLRYIHNNPSKAGICSMDEYKWSSFHEYTGESDVCNTGLALYLLGGKVGFIKFHYAPNSDYIDEFDRVSYLTDPEARRIICGIIKNDNPQKIHAFDRHMRNAMIREMKRWGIGCSQIVRITGLSISIVRKAGK